jgi:hypothetical protein
VSAIFLIKINKGEIRTANPTLSANAKRFNLAVIHHSAKVWVTYTEYIILGRSIVVKRPYELDQIFRI